MTPSLNKQKQQQQAQKLLREHSLLGSKIEQACQQAQQAPALLTEVLCFLSLCALDPKPAHRLVPAHLVDLAWHEFILFTRCYTDFCQANFGRYLHHQPAAESPDHYQDFKQTRQLYYTIFAEIPPPQYWGQILSPQADASDCGLIF